MKRVRSWRSVSAVLAGLCLLSFALAGVGQAQGDPEPVVHTPREWLYDPGPGWPEGWTPPAPPTEIPQETYEDWEWEKSFNPMGAPKWIELRVLPFLPPWTSEYPWFWGSSDLRCGDTLYLYYQPIPDREITTSLYGENYEWSQGATSGEGCPFTPLNDIRSTKPTQEQLRDLEMRRHLIADFDWVMLRSMTSKGLELCDIHRTGTLDRISVCFNGGQASDQFDAPAFLDREASRVRVPIRFVSEMMRAEVSWNQEKQQVTIHFPSMSREIAYPVPEPGFTVQDFGIPETQRWDGGTYQLDLKEVSQPERTIVLTVGTPVAMVDGKEVAIDAPPVNVPPGRVMVPVRFISEVMGAKVYWVGQEPIWKDVSTGKMVGTYQVHIFTPFHPFYEFPNWNLENRAQRF